MKKILLAFATLCCLCPFSVSAQRDIDELIKLYDENWDFMKAYKKEHKLKDIGIIKDYDDFWCYIIYGKNKIYGKKRIRGAVSQEGKIIVPMQYDFIKYYPPQKEGYSRNDWCQNTERTLAATRKIDESNKLFSLYKTDGTIIIKDLVVSKCYDFLTGYFKIAVLDKTTGEEVWGLYTWDGKEILPLKYDLIQIKGKICEYTLKISSGSKAATYMDGALMLDGSLPAVPAQFAEVKYDTINNGWLVRDKETYEWATYNPQKHYTSDIKDEGVRMYWAGKYDDVIKFYSEEGIDKPWAKYYTGASILEKADELYYTIKDFIEVSKKGQMNYVVNGVQNRQRYMNLNADFELIKQLYSTGYSMLNAYLEQDTVFRAEVLKKTDWRLDWRLETIDQKETEFKTYWATFQEQNAAIIQQQREKQERQNAIYQAFLTGFMKGLENAVNARYNNQNNSQAQVSGNRGVNTQISNQGVSHPVTTSTTTTQSRGIDHARLAEWQARKANAERMIMEYNQQLIKNPNDAAVKSMLRTQQNILNNCNTQISLIQSGQ